MSEANNAKKSVLKEADVIRDYLDKMSRMNKNNKIKTLKKLFLYIISTKEVLKFKPFRNRVIERLNIFWNEPSVKNDPEFIQIYKDLSTKLKTDYGEDLSREPFFMDMNKRLGIDPDELITAVKIGDIREVQRVFANGATDINYQRKKDGKTALHMAYGFKNLEIIQFLIDHGADINIEDNDGDTPVQFMLGQTPYDIAILEYTITIPGLSPTDGKDIAYILNKELPVNKYKRLGMGSYGLVVSPSFKTMNNTKVTKFMFKKNTYDESLKASRNIKRNLPLLNTLSEEYPEVYTYSNVATNNAQVGKVLKALNPAIKNTNRVYPILMENLGVSFDKLKDSDIPALAAIPIKTLLEQYMKLADTIIELKTKGYIHGDIRQTNVVINLQSGKITIIDFDWLMPVDEFKNEYENTFYCHPPELIFSKYKNDLRYTFNTFSNDTITAEEYKNSITDKINEEISAYNFDVIHNIFSIRQGILKTMDEIAGLTPANAPTKVVGNLKYRYNNVMDSSYMEIDSYGLGYSLAYFHTYLEKTKSMRAAEESSILDRLESFSLGLCNPSKSDRMSIEEFRGKIEAELQKFAPISTAGTSTSGILPNSSAIMGTSSTAGVAPFMEPQLNRKPRRRGKHKGTKKVIGGQRRKTRRHRK